MKTAEALDVLPPQERRDALGRRRLCRERREELIREFQVGSLTVAAFARRHGLCYTTVVSWLQRAGVAGYAKPVSSTSSTMKTTQAAPPAFRELRIGTPAPPCASPASTAPIVVIAGGVEARCADAVTAAALIKLLREAR